MIKNLKDDEIEDEIDSQVVKIEENDKKINIEEKEEKKIDRKRKG